MSFFELMRLWPRQETKKILRPHQESKKTQWPHQEQLPKNELFQAHEAMATPRALNDPKAMPTVKQVQKISFFKLLRLWLWPSQEQQLPKNELFQAPEAMAMPRVQEDFKATPRKQEDPMATPRTTTTKKCAFSSSRGYGHAKSGKRL